MRQSAADMVNRCFRHQHPEAYGRAEPAEAVVPTELRYGRGEEYTPGQAKAIAEPEMGDPEAVAW